MQLTQLLIAWNKITNHLQINPPWNVKLKTGQVSFLPGNKIKNVCYVFSVFPVEYHVTENQNWTIQIYLFNTPLDYVAWFLFCARSSNSRTRTEFQVLSKLKSLDLTFWMWTDWKNFKWRQVPHTFLSGKHKEYTLFLENIIPA